MEKAGKKVVFLGNEAIARGALEAGVGVVTSYPGTPSSEVPMVLSQFAKEPGFYFEYSTNEKVALETAAGAAWSNVRSLVCMKHFGLNVAADSLMPIAYTGVKGGLVIFVADDPQAWSSVQSEQDSRYYARLAKLPMLEPGGPQECLEFTKLAFELSEEFEIPVLLRTTTKVSHSIGTVTLGELGEIERRGEFKKDPERFYNFRPELQGLHQELDEKIEQIELLSSRSSGLQSALRGRSAEAGELADSSKLSFRDRSQSLAFSSASFGESVGSFPSGSQEELNRIFSGEGNIGIIASGVGFEYAKEAIKELGINPPLAKIGLTHPLSKEFIADFIKDKEAVLVVEELEPIIENFIERVAKEVNPNLKIHGKDTLPRLGEYSLEMVVGAVEKVFGVKSSIDFVQHKEEVRQAVEDLPPRKPVFCPGCPHRSAFYAVKKVFSPSTSSGQADAIYAGDIGCYMMGAFEPYEMQDFIISMGAGIGLAHGISRVSDQEVVAFIGDSTFFHAGMPGLLNYRFNNDRCPLVVVMDNGVTAMTGHQPNPGSVVKIEDVARALGAEVKVASSFSQKQLIEALRELKEVRGPRVLVSRGECRLLTKRKMRKKGIPLPKFEIVNQKEFEKCKLMEEFSCPAMEKTDSGYRINPDLCWGCAVCAQICPEGIKAVR